MSRTKISDDGRDGKYFHLMVNMADDDLDPYQYRLYGHYKRVCGESRDGACWESTRTTATKCRMSVGKVTSTRRELVEMGFIQITAGAKDQTLAVTLKDMMGANIKRYQKSTNAEIGVHEVNTSVQDMNSSVHEVNQTVHEVKQRRYKEEEDKPQGRARDLRNDFDDVPKDDRLQIIRAWAEALSAPPIGAYKNDANHRIAAEIFRAGYRAPQVALFVREKKKDGYWRDKTLTLQKVAQLMPEWLMNLNAKQTPPPEVVQRPNLVPVEWGVNHFVRKERMHD